jgi:selenocysteine-specific elongation factor
LTGIDPDRLREEKERGMTIDLGFAWLKLPSGTEVGVIDVPGHERFVKNMLAGVGGIDLALLVIAANEGAMPQTREHLAILDLLGIKKGIVVLNKKDLVDEDILALVKMEVEDIIRGTVLENAPVVAVSALTGEGLDELLQGVDSMLQTIEPRKDIGRPRLLIDRIFTIAGSGTVVTGTLIDGSLSVGQEVEIVPGGRKARLRGLQTHRTKIETAVPGSRVAANLVGVAPADLQRGDVLTIPGWLIPTDRIDVKLTLLKSTAHGLRHGTEITFFSGAAEITAKVHLLDRDEMEPGGESWAQLSLGNPVVVVRGDRFIIRSTVETIGGGTIVNTHARRHKRFRTDVIESIEVAEKKNPGDVILAILNNKPLDIKLLTVQSNLSEREVSTLVKKLAENKQVRIIGSGLVYSIGEWRNLVQKAEAVVQEYHHKFPARSGIPKGELLNKLGLAAGSPVTSELLKSADIVEEGAAVRRRSYEVKFNPEQQAIIDAFLRELSKNPYSPETTTVLSGDIISMLIKQGKIVKTGSIIFTRKAYDDMVNWIVDHLKETGKITLAEVRDKFSSSRKYVLSLLEHLDEIKLTKRVGDDRILR